jgi:hypothetical protein
MNDLTEGRLIGKKLHALIVANTEAITQAYHSKPGIKRNKLLVGRDWQIWKPLFAICQVIVPERMTELENCSTYLTSLKTRRLKSVQDMHSLQADLNLVENAKRLVKDAALVVLDVKAKYIATIELIQRLLALNHGWWQGYQCPDSAGKKDIGIGDGDSGKMTLAKMLRLGASEIISPPDVHNVAGRTIRGYVVAEIKEAAQSLR